MNKHISTKGFNGIITIEYDKWLRGEKSYHTGLMYEVSSNTFDIFGWMLLNSCYTPNSFAGLRVPSQFAQKILKSGKLLNGVSKILTSPTHSDSDVAIELGKINDDVSLDIFQCETSIASVLLKDGIGINFIKNEIAPTEDVYVLSNYIQNHLNELDSYDLDTIDSFFASIPNYEIIISKDYSFLDRYFIAVYNKQNQCDPIKLFGLSLIDIFTAKKLKTYMNTYNLVNFNSNVRYALDTSNNCVIPIPVLNALFDLRNLKGILNQ